MAKVSHIKIKVQKYIFLHACIRDLDAGNGDKLGLSRNMSLLCLMKHPSCQGHFILPEDVAQIFVLGKPSCNSFRNLLCSLGCYGVLLRGLDRLGNSLPDQRIRLANDGIRCLVLRELREGIGFFSDRIRLQIQGKLRLRCFLRYDLLGLDHIPGLENGIAALGFIENVLKLVMCGKHDGVHIPIPGAFSIRQTQTAPHHLLPQDLRRCRAQRNDGVEVIDIPSFFKHVDVNHDLNRIIRAFHLKQQFRVGLRFGTLLLGMDNDRFVPVCTIPELIRLDITLHPGSMIGIFTDHQHERLYNRLSMVCGIDRQLAPCVFVAGDSVQQHQFVQLLVPKIVEINIGTGDGKWRPGIPILNRFR